ncbi:hypothetical protein MMC06_006610, partial [Schaereria dolodes]|nr:hypothetical protein [Schaereria dolodes]
MAPTTTTHEEYHLKSLIKAHKRKESQLESLKRQYTTWHSIAHSCEKSIRHLERCVREDPSPSRHMLKELSMEQNIWKPEAGEHMRSVQEKARVAIKKKKELMKRISQARSSIRKEGVVDKDRDLGMGKGCLDVNMKLTNKE